MRDLSATEGKALYAEGKIAGDRVAVASVESRYKYAVAAMS
jgi:hypothetical protein